MTVEKIETLLNQLSEAGAIEMPTLDDGPEEARQKFKESQWWLERIADFLAAVNKLHTGAKQELLALEPRCRCTGPPCTAQARTQVLQRLALLEDARRTGQLRFDQIRIVQKGLRAVARMANDLYGATTSDVWLQRPPGKRKG